MKSFSRPLLPIVCFLALLACACSTTPTTGLSGNTMYSKGLPDMAVVPINGMVPLASGAYVDNFPADSIIKPSARVNYVIYGDTNSQGVKRHAHVIFAELTDKNQYMIMPETFAGPSEIALRPVRLDRRNWVEHTLYEKRQGDWFTEYWDINGYVTPQVWFGKRWSRTYDAGGRVVVEYREPLPDCAKINDSTVTVIISNVVIDMPTVECRREVEAILTRADQAFSMRRASTLAGLPTTARTLAVSPDRSMDLQRHVGRAEYMPRNLDSDD